MRALYSCFFIKHLYKNNLVLWPRIIPIYTKRQPDANVTVQYLNFTGYSGAFALMIYFRHRTHEVQLKTRIGLWLSGIFLLNWAFLAQPRGPLSAIFLNRDLYLSIWFLFVVIWCMYLVYCVKCFLSFF